MLCIYAQSHAAHDFSLRKKMEERGFSGGGGVGGGEKNSDPLEQRGYAAYTGSQGPG